MREYRRLSRAAMQKTRQAMTIVEFGQLEGCQWQQQQPSATSRAYDRDAEIWKAGLCSSSATKLRYTSRFELQRHGVVGSGILLGCDHLVWCGTWTSSMHYIRACCSAFVSTTDWCSAVLQ